MFRGYIEDEKGRCKYPIRVTRLTTGWSPDISGEFVVDHHFVYDAKSEPSIKKVIFNPPATIVLWDDNTKTVVKCGEHDDFDPEKGLVMAITKKLLDNKGNYYNVIKNLLKEADYQYNEEDVYDLNIPRTVVKKIRWKHRDDYDPLKYKESYFECPLCGDEILKSGARYCANCGQRLMWEEK